MLNDWVSPCKAESQEQKESQTVFRTFPTAVLLYSQAAVGHKGISGPWF